MNVPGFWGLLAGFRALSRRIDDLQFQVDGLQASHKRLSGRIAATPVQGGSAPPPDRPASGSLSSKDEIRRQIAAGRFRGPQLADQRTESSEG